MFVVVRGKTSPPYGDDFQCLNVARYAVAADFQGSASEYNHLATVRLQVKGLYLKDPDAVGCQIQNNHSRL